MNFGQVANDDEGHGFVTIEMYLNPDTTLRDFFAIKAASGAFDVEQGAEPEIVQHSQFGEVVHFPFSTTAEGYADFIEAMRKNPGVVAIETGESEKNIVVFGPEPKEP